MRNLILSGLFSFVSTISFAGDLVNEPSIKVVECVAAQANAEFTRVVISRMSWNSDTYTISVYRADFGQLKVIGWGASSAFNISAPPEPFQGHKVQSGEYQNSGALQAFSLPLTYGSGIIQIRHSDNSLKNIQLNCSRL